MDKTNITKKMYATILLRKHDQLRMELRTTERELAKAVTEYGRETGYWGLTKDHFRIQLDNEERIRLEDAADRDAMERAHG
jgi:hypothetical protein